MVFFEKATLRYILRKQQFPSTLSCSTSQIPCRQINVYMAYTNLSLQKRNENFKKNDIPLRKKGNSKINKKPTSRILHLYCEMVPIWCITN
jgi:hypothetical protein